jgi:hypothetical protein
MWGLLVSDGLIDGIMDMGPDLDQGHTTVDVREEPICFAGFTRYQCRESFPGHMV